MLASIMQYQQYFMIGAIATAALSILIKLFSRGKPRVSKLRKKGSRRFKLFFTYPHIEKFRIHSPKVDTPECDSEDKFNKMKNFLDSSQEKTEKLVIDKQDQIFFKLLKNFSTIYNENESKNTKSKKKHNKKKLIDNSMKVTLN